MACVIERQPQNRTIQPAARRVGGAGEGGGRVAHRAYGRCERRIGGNSDPERDAHCPRIAAQLLDELPAAHRRGRLHALEAGQRLSRNRLCYSHMNREITDICKTSVWGKKRSSETLSCSNSLGSKARKSWGLPCLSQTRNFALFRECGSIFHLRCVALLWQVRTRRLLEGRRTLCIHRSRGLSGMLPKAERRSTLSSESSLSLASTSAKVGSAAAENISVVQLA